MAEVYKVWDAHRSTALAMKVLHEDLAYDRVFMRRFQREANTLAQLQHPNIVRFYGLEQDGPLAFMLLDYVDGENLKRLIFDAAGPMSPDQTLLIMRSVCSALQFAHGEGMVHCDIKPGNIMIHRNGTVLVADFGIARMTDAATTTMVGMGTPAYMAPEQIGGLDPTPGTDIYALGIVLYEMLTGGERPFTGEHAQTTGSTSEKVRWEHIHLEAPSPRLYNPDISPELEAVVFKCLHKEPNKRFGSALDLSNAIERATRSQEGEELQTVITPVVFTPPAPVIAEPKMTVPQETAQVAAVMEPELVEPAPAESLWRRPAVWIGAGSILVLLTFLLLTFCMCALLINSFFPSAMAALLPRENRTPTATTTVKLDLTTQSIPAPSLTIDALILLPPTETPVAMTDTPTSPSPPTDSPVSVTSTPAASEIPDCVNAGDTWTSPFDGMTLVCVSHGEFWMGADDTDPEAEANEKPGRFVNLDAFWIDRTEVTNNQYEGCVQDGVCRRPSTTFGDRLDAYYGNPQYQNHPVVNVNWQDAATYCEWAGRSLPSEAQWEKAARGTYGFTYPWGEGVSCSLANIQIEGNICGGGGMTSRVGSFPEGTSPYGALDMAGNVWEWVADWISDDYRSEPKPNCSDSSSVECRVVRGGGWSNDAAAARATNRTARFITAETSKVGFRCALGAP
jgi:serine/threonine-protein kinase